MVNATDCDTLIRFSDTLHDRTDTENVRTGIYGGEARFLEKPERGLGAEIPGFGSRLCHLVLSSGKEINRHC